MEIKIVWSELSIKQLKNIYYYYYQTVSPGTAKKIATKIVDRVSILFNNPDAGPKEELLKDRAVEFRYLVVSNYKIIYFKDENIITIASVFDCRQNPEKMKNI